ncbi:MAG: HAMP domain-containing protein [Pseudomonadales bacterium]|nr:HAMP domain-containing protein [Pseudomonadales bacterium]
MTSPPHTILKSRFLWQLYGAFGLMMLICIVMFGFVSSSQMEEDARLHIREGLNSQATMLQFIMKPYLVRNEVFDIHGVGHLGDDPDTRITLINPQGLVLADNREDPSHMNNHARRPEILAAMKAGMGASERYSETVGFNMLYLARRVEENDALLGYVRVALPLASVERQLQSLREKLILSACVITLVFLAIGFVISRAVTSPIIDMTRVASRIARGEFNLRVPSLRQDEIGLLAKALNDLAEGAERRIEQVTHSHDQISAVLSGLAEGVIAVDTDQRIIHINAAARDMLRLENRDMSGLPLWEVVRISEICQVVDHCMTELKGTSTTIRQGKTSLDFSVVLMKGNEKRGQNGAIIVLEDVTDMLHLQQIRTDFVANASHELKTPIAAIRGFVETIIDDPAMDSETRQRFLDRIRSQSARLDNIVQDLLALSRFDNDSRPRSLSSVDLVSLVSQVCSTRQSDAQDAGVTLTTDLPEQRLEIDGEYGALDQMISNLVENAIKYSDPATGRVEVRMFQQDDLVLIQVEDNGIGIPAEEQQRIFERFYRVDRARSRDLGGTGLGLSIVKHVALAHKGAVEVQSSPQEGTVFTVRLPLHRPA